MNQACSTSMGYWHLFMFIWPLESHQVGHRSMERTDSKAMPVVWPEKQPVALWLGQWWKIGRININRCLQIRWGGWASTCWVKLNWGPTGARIESLANCLLKPCWWFGQRSNPSSCGWPSDEKMEESTSTDAFSLDEVAEHHDAGLKPC